MPCSTGNTAPPNTPIMNTPEAREVYSPSPSTASVNTQLHITEWNKPTADKSHRFSVSIAAVMSTIAPSATVMSIGRGFTLFIEADTIRPMKAAPIDSGEQRWRHIQSAVAQLHSMKVDVVADAHLRTYVEEDGDDAILKIAERPNAACVSVGSGCRVGGRSCALYVGQGEAARCHCCDYNAQSHQYERKRELRSLHVVERHTGEHYARHKERRDGCAERVDGAGEVHALHGACTWQRIGGNVRIDDHLKHGGSRTHEERTDEEHEVAERHKVAVYSDAFAWHVLGTERRGGVEQKSADHHYERSHQRTLVAYLVEHTPRARAVEQIAEEEGEGDECGERVAHRGGIGEKRHLERSLTLSVDGGEETDNKVYKGEEQERTCGL